MKILLTNDDGFGSDGITTLEEVLVQHGHDVWVCAPESQRSACSSAISMHQAVKIHKMYDKHYTCSGYPVDCVLFSLLGAVPVGQPDMVISGINHGFNISTDYYYSGTVGAAGEAALHNIPAIALSCETVDSNPDGGFPKARRNDVFPFKEAAEFIAENIDMFNKQHKAGCYFNVNVPDKACGEWTYATLGKVTYHDVLVPEGEESYRVVGAKFPDIISTDVEKTDFYNVFINRKITVSLLKVEP